ncbi:MAG TPA: choice-of-anchor Q domain-containing protein [Thermomicrobiales bacterium]|jgi:hypothetical protein
MMSGTQILAILAMLISLLSGAFPTLVPVVAAAPGPSAAAVTFDVNDTNDVVDAAPGNGTCATGTNTCTLRAAIQEANALAVASPNETFTINLASGATYVLTLVNLPHTPEDLSALGDLDIKANVTINGNGATVDGNSSALRASDKDDQQDRVFHVFSYSGSDVEPAVPAVVEFNNLTVTNGYAFRGGCNECNGYVYGADGGGILNSDFRGEYHEDAPLRAVATTSSLTLRNVTVTKNATGSGNNNGVGGGIFNSVNRTLNVIDCTIRSNGLITDEGYYPYGTILGGGIVNNGLLMISGMTTFQDNGAGSGGALYNFGSALIDGATFRGNSALGEGAGGAIANFGALTLKNSKVIGNSAAVGGGLFSGLDYYYRPNFAGAAAIHTISTTIENTEIANNTALVFGGGVANVGYYFGAEAKASESVAVTLEMRGGSLVNNTTSGFPYGPGGGGSGGALANIYGTVSLTGVNIAANSAGAYGAGDFRFGAGGGIFNLGAMTIDQSAITGNFVSGAGPGGAIANGYAYRYFFIGLPGVRSGDVQAADIDTMLTVTNTTISGNNAPNGSGAVYNVDNSVATLTNVTVAGNQNGLLNDPTVSDVPTMFAQESTLTVQNSIVANNAEYNCSGTIVNGGYNIDSAATCAFATGNNSLSNTDPKLGPLAVNAPGTTQTYALLAGSPAIDRIPAGGAGCPATDQRGVTRPQGPGCDVGAYESEIGSFNVTLSTSGPGTLNVTPGTYNYPAGSTQSFTATPNASNVAFIGWTVDGTFVGFGNPLDLPVTKNRTAVATFAAIPTFCDVTPNTPGAVAINQLAARGVIFGSDNPNGPGKCFLPSDTLYRIHVAGMVARAFGWDQEDHGNNFTDKGSVDNDLWRNAGTLTFYNVALGYRDGSYDPTGPVLHAQAVSFVTRAMIRKGYWELQEDNAAYYTAVPTASGHRQDAVTYHFYAGNILGTNAPTDSWGGPTGYDQPSTRTYFAQVLWQAYSSYFSTNHIP